MKKKLALTAIIAIAAIGGAVALALAGSMSDPLISLDYLEGDYQSELLSEVSEQVGEAYKDVYETALEKIEITASTYREKLSGVPGSWRYYHDYETRTVYTGETVTLYAGSGLLFLSGTASASAQGGEVIDLTAGSAGSTMALNTGHRYLAGEDAMMVVTIQSESAKLSVTGLCELPDRGFLPFRDVAENAWYADAVEFVYTEGLFSGVSDDSFSPGSALNRAMLATVLHRLAGEPGGSSSAGFSDIASGTWYEAGINWSASQGIVEGMGAGRYEPNQNVTRQQLAVMLYRYASGYAKMNTDDTASLNRFTDAEAISDWAEEALSWAVGSGIITGDSNGALNPAGSASRAEAATMLQRFAALLAS